MPQDLITALKPFCAAVASADLGAAGVLTHLEQAVTSDQIKQWEQAIMSAHIDGTLTPHGQGSIRFGRIAKPQEATLQLSLDAVDIIGAALGHTHPQGEVSWCIPLNGQPLFHGVRRGWRVFGPQSHHIPEVTGGRMLIVYAIPRGEIVWDKPALS